MERDWLERERMISRIRTVGAYPSVMLDVRGGECAFSVREYVCATRAW